MSKKSKRAKKAGMEQGTVVQMFDLGPPFIHSSDTSIEAAEQIAPHVLTLRDRVFHYVENHGPVTDEEIARYTGLNPSTARPRRLELQREGRIIQAGYAKTTSGRRATLWAVA